jgi:hypothetical protein
MQFGDQDGIGSEVLLQHPLGVVCGKDGIIYITDSYNHKVDNSDQFTFEIIIAFACCVSSEKCQ